MAKIAKLIGLDFFLQTAGVHKLPQSKMGLFNGRRSGFALTFATPRCLPGGRLAATEISSTRIRGGGGGVGIEGGRRGEGGERGNFTLS